MWHVAQRRLEAAPCPEVKHVRQLGPSQVGDRGCATSKRRRFEKAAAHGLAVGRAKESNPLQQGKSEGKGRGQGQSLQNRDGKIASNAPLNNPCFICGKRYHWKLNHGYKVERTTSPTTGKGT